MVKGFNKDLLPEEDAASLWASALYVPKEPTENALTEP